MITVYSDSEICYQLTGSRAIGYAVRFDTGLTDKELKVWCKENLHGTWHIKESSSVWLFLESAEDLMLTRLSW